MSGIWGDGLSIAQVARLRHAGYPPASFGLMAEGVPNGAATIPAADVIYLYPFTVWGDITVTTIAERCQALGAGSAVKFAVWANNYRTGRPTGLPILGQNDGLATTSTGNKSLGITGVQMHPSLYWCGTKATGTMPAMLGLSSTSYSPSCMIPQATLADVALPSSGQVTGFSTPDAYANDIMAKDMTAAVFTPVATSGIPVLFFGWA